MSWLSEFVDVYNQNEKNLGKTNYKVYHLKKNEEDKSSFQMLPISHIYLNCQLQIDLKNDGSFAGASVVVRDDQRTIVPATIDSSTRSSNLVPNPIDDKLQYVARDFSDWSGEEKFAEFHNKYLKQLKDYLDFLEDYGDQDVYQTIRAIFRYVSEGDIIKDLQANKIFGDADNKKDIAKNVVRFNVRNSENIKRFEDRRFFDAWIRYYQQVLKASASCGELNVGTDYITGAQNVILTNKHPKEILEGKDAKAKLISANDSTNFTFKGRFLTADEAATIGYEASQKAHAAMKWLLTKQGFTIGNRYYLAWEVNGEDTTDLSIVNQNPLFALAQKQFAEKSEINTNENIAENLRKVLIDGAKEDNYSLQGAVHLIELETRDRIILCVRMNSSLK